MPVHQEASHFSVREIGDGVYAAVSKPGTGAGSNAGIVDLGGATLVFDSMMTPAAGRELREVAEDLAGQPVRYVVLSHRDYDHVLGAQAFSDAVVIATDVTDAVTRRRVDGVLKMRAEERREVVEDLIKQVEEAETPALRTERQGFLDDVTHLMDYQYADLAPHYPDVRFQGTLTIAGTRRALALRQVGAVHTESDVVGWLADERVLFTGDMVQVDNHPAIRYGKPDDWSDAMERIAAFDARVVVSGHGPVAGPEAIELASRYYAQLPAMATEETLVEPFKSWRARDVWRENLRYLESLAPID